MENEKLKTELPFMEAKVEKKTKSSLTMKNLKLIFLIIFLAGLFFPLVNFAALNSYQVDGQTVTYEGLVPCGKSKETLAPGESPEVANPCQFCHFFVMFKSILDFVLKLVIIIGVLMLTVGGFMFFFAGGNPGILAKAKSILTSVAIGLGIIFAAWLIVNSILTFPGFINPQFGWDPTKWFQVECSIKPFVEKEKEDYQKKITATEKEIAQLEEEKGQLEKDLVAAKKRGDTDTVQQTADAIVNINKQLAAKGEEEKEKHCRCEECGPHWWNPCDKKECEALGDSVCPCQFIPTMRNIITRTEYGECKPK